MHYAPIAGNVIQRKVRLAMFGVVLGFVVGGLVGMVGFFSIETFPWMFVAFFGATFGGMPLGGLIGWKVASLR